VASIVIVGDGPGGLSAALFLAKAGHEVTVFGRNKGMLNYALLKNYLGIPEIAGPSFVQIARGQVEAVGGVIREAKVASVEAGDGFTVTTEDGETASGDYLILTEGGKPKLAREIGLREADGAIVVDREFRSSLDRVYVVGRSARPHRSQAIISAGAGATAAVDILSREAGKDVEDWDEPPQE
jgi:thioredoxin reductase